MRAGAYFTLGQASLGGSLGGNLGALAGGRRRTNESAEKGQTKTHGNIVSRNKSIFFEKATQKLDLVSVFCPRKMKDFQISGVNSSVRSRFLRINQKTKVNSLGTSRLLQILATK